MKIGLHTDRRQRFTDYLLRFEKVLNYNNIECRRLYAGDPDFFEKVKDLDHFIFRFNVSDDQKQIAESVMPVLENQLNIKCSPDNATSWHYDNKIAEFYMLKVAGFPVPDTHVFYDRNNALKALKSKTFPVIFKLKSGSKSGNVILVKDMHSASRLIRKMFHRGVRPGGMLAFGDAWLKDFSVRKFGYELAMKINRRMKGEDLTSAWQTQKNYVLFQEYLPGNSYDTRVFVCGNHAFAFRRFNRKEDFRASGSGMVDIDPVNIDPKMISIAFRISDHFGFQSMAYDFVYSMEKEPYIIEFSYISPDKTLSKCPGYWDRNLQWHEGKYWPQYIILKEFLNLPGLLQPDWSDMAVPETTNQD